MAACPDGRTLAVGGDTGSLQLWDVATRQLLGPADHTWRRHRLPGFLTRRHDPVRGQPARPAPAVRRRRRAGGRAGLRPRGRRPDAGAVVDICAGSGLSAGLRDQPGSWGLIRRARGARWSSPCAPSRRKS
ncbi:hypothetical protein [Streptomyces sp. IMTB 2501]|uniref:hypothetical protein n=1 Tax=Streptomyces sp. IMTB 2501 TaxID=1776340 RepID=UPI003531B731